jgi:hypothetical protein
MVVVFQADTATTSIILINSPEVADETAAGAVARAAVGVVGVPAGAVMDMATVAATAADMAGVIPITATEVAWGASALASGSVMVWDMVLVTGAMAGMGMVVTGAMVATAVTVGMVTVDAGMETGAMAILPTDMGMHMTRTAMGLITGPLWFMVPHIPMRPLMLTL